MKFRSDFFNNPSFRLSQRCVLNDPFELSPDQDTLDNILESEHREDFYQQIAEYASDESFDDTGVISFTESYNNLLMWSHYADEPFVSCVFHARTHYGWREQTAKIHNSAIRSQSVPPRNALLKSRRQSEAYGSTSVKTFRQFLILGAAKPRFHGRRARQGPFQICSNARNSQGTKRETRGLTDSGVFRSPLNPEVKPLSQNRSQNCRLTVVIRVR